MLEEPLVVKQLIYYYVTQAGGFKNIAVMNKLLAVPVTLVTAPTVLDLAITGEK